MYIIFDTINITLLVVALIYIIFLYLIYFKSKNRLIGGSYSVAISTILLWTVAMILYRSAPESSVLFWCKALYISSTFTASSFFIFSIIFPNGKFPCLKSWFLAVFFNIVVVILIIVPNLVIREVDIIPGKEKEILWGNFYILFSLYISLFFLMGLVNLYNKYRKEYGSIKSQIKFV